MNNDNGVSLVAQNDGFVFLGCFLNVAPLPCRVDVILYSNGAWYANDMANVGANNYNCLEVIS